MPHRATLIGKRDCVILGFLLACRLQRAELAALDPESLQMREGRWVLPDLLGRGVRVRTVAVPLRLQQDVLAWQSAAGVRYASSFGGWARAAASMRKGSAWTRFGWSF